jgi:hypothetical protein
MRLALLLALLAAPAAASAAVEHRRTQQPPTVALVRLAPAKLTHCRRSRLLRPACPTRVPRVRASYLTHLARDLGGPHPLDVFNLERGGEHPQRPQRNRPPRMAHLLLIAGDVERAAAFDYPNDPTRLRDGLMLRPRTKAIDFGTVGWAGRRGRLYLAPPHLHGGMLGNHLVFRWQAGATEYAVTLHAWEPLREAAATLRAVVASTPG